MASEEMLETRSITCSQLPAEFIIDKQEAKKFFTQFGNIKNFIFKSSRQEYIIEYSTVEAAQKALNASVNFKISPTKPEPIKSSEEFDPDVQAELESMLPVGSKTIVKQNIENFLKNPPQMLFQKSKLFSASKQKSTEPITVNADHSLIQMAKTELENLTKKPARTLEEKFTVLDSRDKLYRLLTARPIDIKKATSIKGTCKDMCPEKERLMREARLQVASFELDENSEYMDPMKAIKQYSRSSADQEIPLPHELRPEEVLRTTMTYLLHNIFDLCDDEDTGIGDWYHFLWDRTRGIRKDITQQEFCSEISVELLEQCARFHIHCSARLVAEEPGIFDQKINDENLTKSLQTLKYMYDDLKLKNIKCKNEAEFRAYVVLLNLNESGNFLWEIKRLEKDILKSDEMRFALDVYFALTLNNYVKFFNLVREASYMNACILMKYFTQVRLRALDTISRSTLTVMRKAFSISYLTNVLAFEDDEATVNFMQYHGSTCDLDSNLINLAFQKPELPFQMERSSIVESKLEGTVSEAICGGSLPSPECFMDIQPHSSFDENGFLKKGAFYAEDQNGPLPVKDTIFKMPKESPPSSNSPKTTFQQKSSTKKDQTDGTSTSDNIFGKNNPFDNPFLSSSKSNVFGSFNTNNSPFQNTATTTSIFGELKSPQSSAGTSSLFGSTDSHLTIQSSSLFPKPFLNDSPNQMSIKSSSSSISITSSSSNIFESPASQTSQSSQEFSFGAQMMKQEKEREAARLLEEQRLEEEKRRRESEQAEERMRQKLEERARLENERREAERLRLEEEERQRKIMEEEKQRKLQKDAENICENLIDEIVASKVSYEVKRAYKLYIELPRDFYDALEYDIVIEELIKLYRQEHLSYINMTKLKYETMSNYFNYWRKITAKEKNRRALLSNIGCPNLNKSLEEHALDISHPQQQLALSNMKQYLSGSPQQIQLPDLDSFKKINLFKELNFSQQNLPNKLFWKILISVPLKNIEKSMSFACFIKKWLNKSFDVNEESEKKIFYLKRQVVQKLQMMMSICIRKVQGAECVNEKGEKCTEIAKDANSLIFFCTTANLKESRKRLQNILNQLDNPIFVSIIVYKSIIERTDEELLRLNMDLTHEPKVKSFEINLYYECENKSKNLSEVVIESFQFLCDNYLQQLTNEYSKLFDLEMQYFLDYFQFYFGDEMWQRIEFSCNDNRAFDNYMASFNNVIQIFNACIDKNIKIFSNKFHNLPSLSYEFKEFLPQMEVRIPQSFEYFPSNWKTNHGQENLVKFLHDLKLKTMNDDNFKDFQNFKEKLSIFLQNNCPSFKNQVFQAVIERIIQNVYFMQLKGLDSVDDAISRMRWLQILSCIVIGKFNELYQQRKESLPKFVIYYKKDLKNYVIPWWYTVNFNLSKDFEIEPIKKKAKLTQNIDSNELQAVLSKGKESIKKANEIITNSRDNTQRTREDSKTFDQFLYNCEEKFRGMKRSLKSMQENHK
ncbi:hypothetical protein PVAND_012699 [Polypedilum vanderplanki]|uniref:SAC3/GANP/THP3 conserved domain-containing protein n=1 Tax=Polypedilum vanderplanki TaxID=319348 RepID=A0A9J6CN91_POLVA|nr:hypothetical protein PVAND_012699 [Polypedilum vanderplanki]